MYLEIFGRRVNLVTVTVIVAIYDLLHILYEFRERFTRFETYENTTYGCIKNMFQVHCMNTYGEIAVYSVDFIFTVFLIYGASRVR